MSRKREIEALLQDLMPKEYTIMKKIGALYDDLEETKKELHKEKRQNMLKDDMIANLCARLKSFEKAGA